MILFLKHFSRKNSVHIVHKKMICYSVLAIILIFIVEELLCLTSPQLFDHGLWLLLSHRSAQSSILYYSSTKLCIFQNNIILVNNPAVLVWMTLSKQLFQSQVRKSFNKCKTLKWKIL